MKKTFLLLFIFSNLFSSELINVNFKNLELKELIKITSQNINKSILVAQEVQGKVDFISNEPIKKEKLFDILNYSLNANGYKLVEENGIFRVIQKTAEVKEIIPKNLIKKPTKDIKKYSNKKSKNYNYHSEVIFLTNIEAKSLEKILKSIISQRDYSFKTKPSIAIDEEFNSLIIDGTINEINNLKSIIKKVDIIKPQVYIKAKIIELDNNLLEDVGIKLGVLGGKVHSGGIYTFSSNLNNGDAISIDTTSIGLKIPNVSSSLALGASLNLLNKTYALDVISEPSILCINNKESSIYVGETVSIQTGSITTDGGNTKTTFQREDIGLTLKVKSRVSNDNKVNLQINTILEGIKSNNTNSNPDTSKKEVKTTVVLNNGESVILGGLIERKSEKTIQKVPIAGDIPLIGELFKNRLNDSYNKSLVVIVTPFIIPKSKDLTYVRKELAKLKNLEDDFLEQVLIRLKERKNLKSKNFVKKNNDENLKKHKERLKKYFGI